MAHGHHGERAVFGPPMPTDIPYCSAAISRSCQPGQRGSTSPEISSSPPPLPAKSPTRGQDAHNAATDDNVSALDLRRFTPSLHASLVSEILSLRREVEAKTKDIDHLEASLHTTRNENESLHETISSSNKEARSLKRQMQLLEGGTATALSELAKERVQALNDSADLRKRLEQSQKKAKSQEESIDRSQTLWDHDRVTWEKEKRTLETKVHIVQGRLKVVLDEIATSHMVNGQMLHQDANYHGSPKKMHLRKGSTNSIRSIGALGRRRDSEASSGTLEGDFARYRLSTMSLANGHSTSLADELGVNEEEEDMWETNGGQDELGWSDEPPENRPASVQSRASCDLKARKVLALASENQLPVVGEKEQQRQAVAGAPTDDMTCRIKAPYKVQYVDAAAQCSPPPSPTLPPQADDANASEDDNRTIQATDGRSRPEADVTATDSPSSPPRAPSMMASMSCQTLNQLPSPPSSPLSQTTLLTEEFPTPRLPETRMTSTATQTDTVEECGESKSFERVLPMLPVPVIAIHPPFSRPATPTSDVVLPPRTKNASCQADMHTSVEYTSSSMQTEEIRVDSRTAQLPQVLRPPRKSSQAAEDEAFRRTTPLLPAIPLPNSSRRRLQQAGPTKAASSRRKAWEAEVETLVPSPPRDANDGVFATQSESLSRTSISSTSLFAADKYGYENSAGAERMDFDDDDFFSRPTAKFTLKAGKLVSKNETETNYEDIFAKIDAEAHPPEVLPADDTPAEMPTMMLSRRGARGDAASRRTSEFKQKTLGSAPSRRVDIRKAALISSGAAAHQSGGDLIPSAPVKPPPFPVPIRHSSRKLPISYSEGAQSPTPAGRSPRKKDGRSQKPSLRKARSATSVSRVTLPPRRRTPSPPLLTSHRSTGDDAGLALPPLPFDDNPSPTGLALVGDRGSSRPSPHAKTESASTVVQQTSVVDAIAQTMVGEWMYKYVRRRKSFGVSESVNTDWDLMRNGEELSANITNSGVRHKRWVWLAPYDRAVMWSSKQPTSGSALMGKSGRKLDIQSVLDVRDDNPLPRGSGPGPNFQRSILILTPQRALKFTATSQERHYVWLTALSFLSHSPLGLGDLTAIPHVPEQEYRAPAPPAGSLRRNPIRDSIRVAKGRDTRPDRSRVQRSFTTDAVIPQHEHSRYDSVSDAADPPTIPRYHSHTRQRSNTNPRSGVASFRNFSNHILPTPTPTSTYSMTTTTTSSDLYTTPSLYNGPSSSTGFRSLSSRRGSEASGSIRTHHPHHQHHHYHHKNAGAAAAAGSEASYFDPYTHAPPLTKRMEAFIGEDGATERPRGSYRTRQGRKKDMGYWGVEEKVLLPAADLTAEVGSRSRSPGMAQEQQQQRGSRYPVWAGGRQIDRRAVGVDDGGRGDHFRGF